MKIHVVSHSCPVGCGSEVVLLKPNSSEPIFSYCGSCGCCWSNPDHAQFEAGLEYIKGPHEFSISSVRLPTDHEIDVQKLRPHIIETLDLSEYRSDIIGTVNDEISKKQSSLNDHFYIKGLM